MQRYVIGLVHLVEANSKRVSLEHITTTPNVRDTID